MKIAPTPAAPQPPAALLPAPIMVDPSGGRVTQLRPAAGALGVIDTVRQVVLTTGLKVIERVLGSATSLGTPLASPARGADPVLLVGGWANGDGSWDAYARTLARDGFDTYIVTVPGNAMNDLMDGARFLNEQIERVRSATHARTVDVIGFSAGGLIARAAARQLAAPGSIDSVITLGSPNHGLLGESPLWKATLPFTRVGYGVAASQMLGGSDFLRALNDPAAVDAAGRAVRYTSVYSAITDGAVIPTSSARLDRGTNLPIAGERNVLKLPIGPDHYSILHRSNGAYEAVRGALLARTAASAHSA